MPDPKTPRPRRAAVSPPPLSGATRRRHQRHRRARQTETNEIQDGAPDEGLTDEGLTDEGLTDEASSEPAAQAGDPPQDRHGRLWRLLFRPGRGQVIAAVILFVVGMAGVMQIRINSADDTYSNARREDLIQLLDGLGQESRRLESEIAELERTKSNLESGADTERVAREEAEHRIEMLSILAGTLPAEGPGIRMEITDPDNKVTADILLDAVEEMRDAGAEVIEFNNTVRVVGSSWFSSDEKGLIVDGKHVSGPIVIEVIGDPHSLEEGARFRGGIVSEITGPKIGGKVQIDQTNTVKIKSLHTPKKHQYAQPASPPPTPR